MLIQIIMCMQIIMCLQIIISIEIIIGIILSWEFKLVYPIFYSDAKERTGATARNIKYEQGPFNSFIFPSSAETDGGQYPKEVFYASPSQELPSHAGPLHAEEGALPKASSYLPVPDERNATSRFFTFNSNRQALDVSCFPNAEISQLTKNICILYNYEIVLVYWIFSKKL